MIGDGWDDEPSVRPTDRSDPSRRIRVVVVTGSRAEYGLLRPVMRAVEAHPRLELLVVAAGSHLVMPARTFHEVKNDFTVAEIVPMQLAGQTGRSDDVQSLARGVARFGRCFEKLAPDWVVILGDRIEAFAAASAASIGGWALAHIHGGDRAEGVADEAMRHAITKLAQLHFPATEYSAARVVRMGEDPSRVHLVGSPAIDELVSMPAMSDEAWEELGAPSVLFLLHPIGRTSEAEEADGAAILRALRNERLLALLPNLDPGRDGIVRALKASGVRTVEHLAREQFVGLLKRLARQRPPGALVGNSSAGLIEAAALKLPVVDIGPRQGGRQRCINAVHVELERDGEVARALHAARAVDPRSYEHPYGDGTSGTRIAEVLARPELRIAVSLRKRCAY
jgi:UDP-hydrolysing UDP-N-acetyl-D-glucosamine 2-epimerase